MSKPQSSTTTDFSNSFEGKILEVFSGDSFLAEDEKGNKRKMYLSSTKAPLCDNRDLSKSEPWAMEAKEYMRKKLVGKKMQVDVDYRKNVQARGNEESKIR